jgi:putative acetyltransferase
VSVSDNSLEIAEADPRAPECAALIAALDAWVTAAYGAVDPRHMPQGDALAARGALFVVARRDGRAVGCGAVAPLGDGLGEIKRMWTEPEARRTGVARAVLRALQTRARETGLTRLLLETGTLQPEALALYAREGFAERGPFAGHGAEPRSVYMEKKLAPLGAKPETEETAA